MLLVACAGGGGGVPEPADTATTGERAVQVVGAGDVRLFGTLSVPPVGRGPAVLIVPSPGPGDRDGVTDSAGRTDALGADLARIFFDAGIASYRYDRRGTAESRVPPGTPLTFDDQVADARAALDLLTERRETAGRELAVVGYEQGGLVALRVAAADPRVARLVLISAPGRPLVDVQAARLEAQYGPESAQAWRETVAALVATGALPPLNTVRAEHASLLVPPDAAYLADLYRRDPAHDAAQVRVPTMLVLSNDPAPYDPARLTLAPGPLEVISSPAGGPSLLVTGPPPGAEEGRPVHEHGVAPAPKSTRDLDTIGRIAAYLQRP